MTDDSSAMDAGEQRMRELGSDYVTGSYPEMGFPLSKKAGEQWDRGTYRHQDTRKNPAPKYSGIENLLKRREWKGAVASEPYIHEFRLWIKFDYPGESSECVRCFETKREAVACGASKAREFVERVECIDVHHPSGCVMRLRTMTGDALLEMRRRAWRENVATPIAVNPCLSAKEREEMGLTRNEEATEIRIEQPVAEYHGAPEFEGETRAAAQRAEVLVEKREATAVKGDAHAAYEAACAARRAAVTEEERRTAGRAYRDARKALARAA